MMAAEVKKSLSIFVHFPHAMVSMTCRPNVMVGSHSCIKISQYVQLFCFRNVANSNIQFLVELIFGVCSGAQCWCIGTHNISTFCSCYGRQVTVRSEFFTAKPTPCSRFSSILFRCQTNVYRCSFSDPFSASRVSCKVAMSMFSLSSSGSIMVVFLESLIC